MITQHTGNTHGRGDAMLTVSSPGTGQSNPGDTSIRTHAKSIPLGKTRVLPVTAKKMKTSFILLTHPGPTASSRSGSYHTKKRRDKEGDFCLSRDSSSTLIR